MGPTHKQCDYKEEKETPGVEERCRVEVSLLRHKRMNSLKDEA